MVDKDNQIIVVRKAPSQVCDQCEETVYNNDISKQLKQVVKSLNNSATEVTIVNFDEMVVVT